MIELVLVGGWYETPGVLAPLCEAGYGVALARGELLQARCARVPPALLLVALEEALSLEEVAEAARAHATPWIAWNRDDDPARALAAYAAGARAVLPAALPAAVLLVTVRSALAASPASLAAGTEPADGGERRYDREGLIALERDAVLEVRAGVVASTVIHPDGAEVLLGLCGSGQVVVGHPEDSCCLQLIAHTDATVVVRPWPEAAARPAFPAQLRARLRAMEAWSAMQARPYLDQRVLGILGLLAEQFGRPHPAGTLVDVRLTHARLATAVGASRTTVTRILGELRGRGLLTTAGTGAGERFCLREWERVDHGLR